MGFKHPGSSSFFDHTKDLFRAHVEDFSDSALHNDEVWVVDVELYALKHIENSLLGSFVSIEEPFGGIRKGELNLTCIKKEREESEEKVYLTSDSNLRYIMQSSRRLIWIGVVEDNGYAGLGDTRLTTFVDEVLLSLGSHLCIKV